jgi:hypothetical protein
VRIAICLSGHLRNFEATLRGFRANLVQDHDCDVFIHTWDRIAYQHSWHGSDKRHDCATQQRMRAIEQAYSPKAIVIEPSFHWDIAKYGLGLQTCHENIPMMFYKIKKCNDLRRAHERASGARYDLVVRTRADIDYLSRVDLGRVDPAAVNVPGYGFGCNDQVAVAVSSVMDGYCAAADAFDEYVEQYSPETIGQNYRPELFLRWHLSRAGIPSSHLPMRYSIRRMNGKTLRVQ